MQKLSDSQKLEQLYDLYEQKMYAAAYSILHNEWQAEDAVQEAFVKLLKSSSKIKDPASPESRAYVFQAIKSTAIDQYRRNQNQNQTQVPLTAVDASDDRDDISRMISTLAARMMLDGILTKLSPQYREVIVYRYVHQLSVRETAAVLDIREDTVRKRQQRAIRKMKELTGDVEYEYAHA